MPSLRSPDCQSSKPTSVANPSTYATTAPPLGAPASRRMTRTAGTLRSCSSGGSANPNSRVRPTRPPCSAGIAVGLGSWAWMMLPSQDAIRACAANPARHPATQAVTPSIRNSAEYSAMSRDCVAPRQRITAQPSRWRSTNLRVASAMATPARIAASSAVSPRKLCARSSDARTSGRAFSRLSMRCPRSRRGLAQASNASTSFLSPATRT